MQEARRDAAGVLTIASGRYRATFEPAGVAYTPRTAAGDETRLAWRYRARAIGTASARLALAPVAPAVSPLADHIVEYVRPGLIERYEGEPAGVEQIFVLTTRPAGPGDVRIRGDVAFAGERRVTPAGLEFTATVAAGQDPLPPMRYAHPIAFDADRRPVPVRAEIHGESLDLVLDGAALDRARWPVTVDPLFGVSLVASSAYRPAAAYNVDRGEFLVVYTAVTGAAHTIRGRRYFEDGDAVGPSFAIPTPPSYGHARLPAVAYDSHTNRYLATWLADDANETRLLARVLDSAGATIGSTTILDAPGFDVTEVRVAARNGVQHGLIDPSFVVAWTEENASGGQAARVARVSGAGLLLGTTVADAGAVGGGVAHVDLAFSPSDDRVLLAWADLAPSPDAIRGRSMSMTGSVSGVVTFSDSGANGARPFVAHDVATQRCLVAWSGRAQLASTGSSVTLMGTNVITHATARAFSVAAERGSFVVLFTVNGPTPGLESVTSRRIVANGAVLGEIFLDGQGSSSVDGRLLTSDSGDVFGTHEGTANEIRASHSERWWTHAVHGRGGDFDGDGMRDLFFYRRSTGRLFVRTQSLQTSFTLGGRDAMPVLVEIDGDGLADVGVYARQTGTFVIRQSTTGTIVTVPLGVGGDIPVPGDYVGDERDELAVYRPDTATWYVLPSGAAAPTATVYGLPGDVPVPTDRDGDGKYELSVWRPFNGKFYWQAGSVIPAGLAQLGQMGDIPLQGQFVGSPRADFVVYRRQEGKWYVRDGESNASSTYTQGDGIPMPLDWDGDGRLELALFQWENQRWVIHDLSSPGPDVLVGFGGLADLPAATR